MEYTEGFKYAVGWNHHLLHFIGAWPGSNSGITKFRTFFYFIYILIFTWTPLTASLYPLRYNMDALIECLSINIPLMVAMYKLFVFFYYKKEMKMLIDSIAKDWAVKRRSDEYSAMMKTAKISRGISILSVFLINSLILSFFLFKIWLGTQIRKKPKTHDSHLVLDLLYPAYLPYSTETIKYYLPTWLIQCFSTYFSTAAYASFDSFMSMIVLHICGQLAVIGLSIKNLVNEIDPTNIFEFNQKLGKIVKRHQAVSQLVRSIENSFCVILLPQILACTLTFCFQGFMLTSNLIDSTNNDLSVLEIMFIVAYMFYTILHLFIYCYIGDYLSFESTSIRRSCYESNWYNLPFRKARLLILISCRADKPLVITAGKFCIFSRNLFIVILKTSFGYLSMLLAVKQ